MGIRKKWTWRLMGMILTFVMIMTLAVIPDTMVRAEGTIGDFVNRCYQVALDREADEAGYTDWTNQLNNGQSDGAFVAFGFVFSDEYKSKNKSNEDFVKDMYTLFFGREADEAGYADWVGRLNAGESRESVFAGFTNSEEFYNLCSSYGVTAGTHVEGYDRGQVNAVNMFVARMYKICLNRQGDQAGQADWTNKLLSHELTGIDCANGFIKSEEYTNLGLSNGDYVKNLYLAFMGRDYDTAGYNDWVNKLIEGYTRDEVFAGFANSDEFKAICDSYGINRGDYTATDVHQGSSNSDSNSNSSSDSSSKSGYRLTKKGYMNGQYTLYYYEGNNGYAYKRVRYNSDGSEVGLEYNVTYGDDGRAKSYFSAYYDENGNKLSSTYYETEVISEDENGYVMRRTYYQSDMRTVDAYDEVTYVKDGNRYYSSQTKNYDKNNVYTGKWVYEWGSDSQITKGTSYDKDDNKIYEYEYKYDANGNEQEYNSVSYYNGKASYTSKTVTTYNNAGKRAKEEFYSNGESTGHVDYVYNDKGLLSETKSYYISDGTEALSSREVYEYDSSDNNVKITYYLGDKVDRIYTYEYDANGNETRYARLNAEGTEVYWETNEYEAY